MANIWKFGMVWFNFEWYGTWIMSRCSYMHNSELLAWKITELWGFYWHEFGKIVVEEAAVAAVGFMITKAL